MPIHSKNRQFSKTRKDCEYVADERREGRIMELPVLPLKSVLFPGMPMPIFIYDNSYRQMMEYCLQGEKLFGVSLIKKEGARPEEIELYAIGTVAKIVRKMDMRSGGLHIFAIGTKRFRLLEILQQAPFLLGNVELLTDDEEPEVPIALEEEVRELFGQYLLLLLQLLEEKDADIQLPRNVSRLSYMIAAHLTCASRIRQQLLEIDDLEERLHYEKELLQRENEEFRLLLATRQKYQEIGGPEPEDVFSLN